MSILLRPMITEKSLSLAGRGQFTFVVDPRANAPQVAQAVATQFDVTVTSVHMLRTAGATRSFRFHSGRTNEIKKAIVSVKKGQTIPGFAYETKEDDKKSVKNEKQAKDAPAVPTPKRRSSDRSVGEKK